MQDKENAPEIIFEWLMQPFESLDEKQQLEVLLFFTADEFDEMHRAMVMIEGEKKNQPAAMYRSKQELLEAFDKKFAPVSNVRLLFAQIDIWKAAAVLFFALGSWFAVGYLRPDEFIHPKTVTVTDTVYLEKKFYDTVFVPSVTGNTVRTGQVRSNKRSYEREAISGNFQVRPETLNVLSLDMLNNEENVQKGNSVRDDSLISSFNFITL